MKRRPSGRRRGRERVTPEKAKPRGRTAGSIAIVLVLLGWMLFGIAWWSGINERADFAMYASLSAEGLALVLALVGWRSQRARLALAGVFSYVAFFFYLIFRVH